MTAFETSGHVALRVTLVGGGVAVETTGEPGVVIELSGKNNDATRQAISETRIEKIDRAGGHEIIVHVPRKSGLVIGRGPKIDIRIRCPRGSDLAVRAGSADLDATGTLGAVDVKTASGDVSLDDAVSVAADTASGDVRMRDVGGELSVRTASGDVSVRRCDGPLTANLVSGDLSVHEAASGLTVTTVSGDIDVRAVGGGEISIQAVSGDVQLGIKPGECLFIDASSVSGDISSELALDDGPPAAKDAPVTELRVRTVSGDVEIVRAAAVEA